MLPLHGARIVWIEKFSQYQTQGFAAKVISKQDASEYRDYGWLEIKVYDGQDTHIDAIKVSYKFYADIDLGDKIIIKLKSSKLGFIINDGSIEIIR